MNEKNSKNSKSDNSANAAKPRARGFAAMDRERQRQIASMGGKAAHKSGNAHQFTSDEAREAGRKGGQASQRSAKKKDAS